MIVLELLLAFVKAVVWIGGWSQLVGMPVAWLRLRGTPAWRDRPPGVRRIDLLADFIMRPTVLAIGWAWLVLVAIVLGDIHLGAGQYLALIWGPPTVLVPLAVLRLDPARLPGIVEEKARHAAG